MFRASHDNGEGFGITLRISTNVIDSIQPNIAATEENVYIVWSGPGPQRFYDVFFRRSADSGERFDHVYNLRNEPTSTLDPKIVATGQNVFVTWDNGGTENNQAFMISYDSGLTFVNNVRFNSEPKSIQGPQIAMSRNYLYIVWHHSERDDWMNEEIYFAAVQT